MITKLCCRCKVIKDILYFNKAIKGLYKVHSICKECKKIYMLEYRLSGKLKLSKDKYRKSKKGLTKIKEYTKSNNNKIIQKSYRMANRAACNAKLAKYRAVKQQAMPIWVNTASLSKIYKSCPKSLEVDHILPIQGENISGLHVPWNLQYLTREQNASKSNSFDGTYNNESWKHE